MKCDNQETMNCAEAVNGYHYCSSCLTKLKASGYSDQLLKVEDVPPEDVCSENEFWPLRKDGKITGYYKSKSYAQSIVDGIEKNHPEEEAFFTVGPEKVLSKSKEEFISIVSKEK